MWAFDDRMRSESISGGVTARWLILMLVTRTEMYKQVLTKKKQGKEAWV